jgi:hypothetical protein
MRGFMLVLVVLAGCKDDVATSDSQRGGPPRRLAGVYPEQWRCDSVVTIDALGQLLGGAPKQIESAMAVPAGVPHPCTYQLQAPDQGTLEYWTFDVDCRDNMKQQADALFAQYKETSREAVQRYARADAGAPKHDGSGQHNARRDANRDAGADTFAPEDAVEVNVGAKGLDHHGRGLLFIDDDAPCYVRVIGKDAARRLELAKLIAKNLTFANAPMKPRAVQ